MVCHTESFGNGRFCLTELCPRSVLLNREPLVESVPCERCFVPLIALEMECDVPLMDLEASCFVLLTALQTVGMFKK